ncbi:MAG: cyclic nucleotide-binding domain-containing protein [candidate division NC10 bacterium]|nr:cyclic nucleotide-binding domain-containing protein [candidate division NC10 bacterium]
MFGGGWKVLPGLRTGDWRSKLIALSQIAIGCVALLSLLAMLTRDPLLLLGFGPAQALILLGVVLFVVVAIFAQRTMVLEEFGPGEVIFHEGDQGRHVYVLKSGTVEVLMKRPDGSPEVIRRLGPGEPFGEMALLRNAPRSATIRTVTAAQVFKMSPGNFAALYTNLPGLRESFNTIMESRLREFESRK